MTNISDKLAWVSKNLYETRNKIKKAKKLNDRKELVAALGVVVARLNADISVLPNSLKYEEQDISGNLRKIKTSAGSLIQGLNDKAYKIKEVGSDLNKIYKNVLSIRKLINSSLADRIVAKENSEGSNPKDLDIAVEQTILAADKPKEILHSLEELGRYNDFIEELRNKVKRLDDSMAKEEGEVISPAIDHAMIDSKESDSYMQSLDRPVENLQFREGLYEEKANQNAMGTQKALLDVARQLPKSIEIGKAGYTLVKAPVLVITKYYAPTTVLKKSGVKYIRISNSFGAGYTPGLSPKLGGGESSYLILLNQILIAMPASMLNNPEKITELRRDAFRALQQRMGKLSIIRFGRGSRRVLDKELIHEEPQNTKTRLNEDVFDQAIDKQEFFASKAYPGKIFIWLMPASMFNNLNTIIFLNVDIAAAPGLKKELPIENGKTSESNIALRSKKDQEDYEKRLKRLAKAKVERDKIINPIIEKIDLAKAKIKSAQKELLEVKGHLDNAKTSLQDNDNQLKATVPGSQTYKGLMAARTALSLTITHFESELAGIKANIDSLAKEKVAIKSDLDKAMAEFIAKRKEKQK